MSKHMPSENEVLYDQARRLLLHKLTKEEWAFIRHLRSGTTESWSDTTVARLRELVLKKRGPHNE